MSAEQARCEADVWRTGTRDGTEVEGDCGDWDGGRRGLVDKGKVIVR